ncbi:hypothetical protein KFL_012770010 [Klebsormidium nitens]|uniref:Uncharacterized protein n=1 Tax=Klebsormidium nitens TaxID=105231 RepID=A0A1Y1ISN6_KLENI|nr:hypothetical protein KFL_012770010 [Klebsormidium nitens]|eukprot:GAQ93062.1 hypothetical protein KFL_012770010 [Klebsormidium nitens]
MDRERVEELEGNRLISNGALLMDERPLRSEDLGPGKAMVQALAGLASSLEGLADAVISSAVSRFADPLDAAHRAQEQLAAQLVSDGMAAQWFRARAIELLENQLAKEVERGPLEQPFEEMGRRLAAAKERKRVPPPRSGSRSELSRSRSWQTLKRSRRSPWISEWKQDAGGEYVDGPDPEEAGDEWTLAKEAFSELAPETGFDRSIPIVSLAHEMGVPMNEDNVHATGRHLLGLARANAARLRSARGGKETAKGSASAGSTEGGDGEPMGAGGTESPPTLLEAHEHSLVVLG